MSKLAMTLIVPFALQFTPLAAMANPVQELNKEINVVGINEDGAFVAVQNPVASGPSVCYLSLLIIPQTRTGKLQYETLVRAKIAQKTVTIFFDDSDCVVDQVQLQVD
jgi:hypothetical protein